MAPGPKTVAVTSLVPACRGSGPSYFHFDVVGQAGGQIRWRSDKGVGVPGRGGAQDSKYGNEGGDEGAHDFSRLVAGPSSSKGKQVSAPVSRWKMPSDQENDGTPRVEEPVEMGGRHPMGSAHPRRLRHECACGEEGSPAAQRLGDMACALLALLEGGLHATGNGGVIAARLGGEFVAAGLKGVAARCVADHLDGTVVAGHTKGEGLLPEQAEQQGHDDPKASECPTAHPTCMPASAPSARPQDWEWRCAGIPDLRNGTASPGGEVRPQPWLFGVSHNLCH